jgi:hypothetical protein
VPGCPCAEFHPENDPRGDDTALPGGFHQAHNNLICGVCGHSHKQHTDPFNAWEVKWDDIDVLEKIGEGKHGRVHRCMLAGHKSPYAVKILKSEKWSAKALSNFLREMALLSTSVIFDLCVARCISQSPCASPCTTEPAVCCVSGRRLHRLTG